MNQKTQPVEEATDPPKNPQAPQGWRPGVKFYSPHGRYTLQVSPTVITTVNGVTTRSPGKLIEFHDGEFAPKNKESTRPSSRNGTSCMGTSRTTRMPRA